jgi:hypothetical protein
MMLTLDFLHYHKELTHVEEQEMLKKQFLEAGEKLVANDGEEDDEADEEDGFLKLRSKSKSEREKEQKEDEEFWKAEEKRTGKKQGNGDDVLSSFWLGGELDEKEKFLRKYALSFSFLSHVVRRLLLEMWWSRRAATL